jgi:catechol-2,3-dioxygenase
MLRRRLVSFAFLAAMRERGLERVGGPRVRDDYVEQIYISDPDGHVIELLYQHTPESGHARRRAKKNFPGSVDSNDPRSTG